MWHHHWWDSMCKTDRHWTKSHLPEPPQTSLQEVHMAAHWAYHGLACWPLCRLDLFLQGVGQTCQQIGKDLLLSKVWDWSLPNLTKELLVSWTSCNTSNSTQHLIRRVFQLVIHNLRASHLPYMQYEMLYTLHDSANAFAQNWSFSNPCNMHKDLRKHKHKHCKELIEAILSTFIGFSMMKINLGFFCMCQAMTRNPAWTSPLASSKSLLMWGVLYNRLLKFLHSGLHTAMSDVALAQPPQRHNNHSHKKTMQSTLPWSIDV